MKRILSSLAAFASILFTGTLAFAQEGAQAASSDTGLIALAMGIGIGIAAFGGALGQSRAAAAALEGMARNPNASNKVFVPMILGLAFIESLVLFALVVMFILNGQF